LQHPILYLSAYLKRRRAEYYDRLMAIRDRGDWEGWLAFFLRGVEETAEEATSTARAILQLREDHQTLVHDQGLGRNGIRLLDLLFSRPVVNVRWVERELGVTYATANNLLARFAAMGVIEEITGAKRNRRFRYSPYLALFEQPDAMEDGSTEATIAQGDSTIVPESVSRPTTAAP
jgi:Fic family protein